MLGSIIGDIIGSVHEGIGTKTKDFPLFIPRSIFTDDSILTVAVADWILTKQDLTELLQAYYRNYPGRGYGGMFCEWAGEQRRAPYNSFGNGSAMRVSPVGFAFETIDDIAVGDIRKRVRTILGSFLFSGETIDKKVKVLSGGEKSRLSLAKLLLTPSNLLILDEPTNHLDMQSKDILKNALIQFDGTLIIVSHDRDFLQGLTNKVFEFRDQKIKEHLGDIYDFLEYRKVENLKQLEKAKKYEKGKEINLSDNKINWEKKKQFEKDQRKLNSQITKCEEKIEQIELELNKLSELLSNPKSYTTETNYFELSKQYDQLKTDLETEMQFWEELHQKLEEMNEKS